jgi:hypothetical protein
MLGKGPFPGVLFVRGSGAVDMNEQIGTTSSRFWQIAQKALAVLIKPFEVPL